MIDATFWNGRRVLVTGHTGFKGAWLTSWLDMLGAEVTGLSLAPMPRSLFVDARVERDCASHFVDVRDAEAVRQVVITAKPEVVFHLAAQSLVRVSYAEAAATWMTNTMGTVNLLDALRAVPETRAIVVVTSDKCYEQQGAMRPFHEADPLGGHDPYSSSKAAAEIAVASWRRSFFDVAGVGVATARAGNVIGGGDWAVDRLIPDLVRSAIVGQSVSVRSPNATRPWQHVLDPLHGYLLLAQRLVEAPARHAGAWNLGPDSTGSTTVSAIAGRFVEALDRGAHWTAVANEGGVHEAATLALDNAKARGQLGWRPTLSIDEAIALTAEAYRVAIDRGDQRAVMRQQIARHAEHGVIGRGARIESAVLS